MKKNTNDPLDRPPADLDDEGFMMAIEKGLSELDCGESIPLEEVERQLPSWIIKSALG